jgi:hypothetical protein
MLSSSAASVRDRTPEFLQIVARLQQQHGLPTSSGRDAAAAAGSAGSGPQSEFARRAAKIGMGIHSTSQKLQKLAQLARRTSMFDDPAEEINELSTVVKQDIQVCDGGVRQGRVWDGGERDRGLWKGWQGSGETSERCERQVRTASVRRRRDCGTPFAHPDLLCNSGLFLIPPLLHHARHAGPEPGHL